MPTSTAIPSYFRREKVCTLSLHLSQAHTHPLVLTQVSIGSAMKFPPARLCKIQFGALVVCDTWTYSKDIWAFQMAAAAGGTIQRRDCAVPFAYYFQFCCVSDPSSNFGLLSSRWLFPVAGILLYSRQDFYFLNLFISSPLLLYHVKCRGRNDDATVGGSERERRERRRSSIS
jgi:hypothetical protein